MKQVLGPVNEEPAHLGICCKYCPSVTSPYVKVRF